MNALGRNPGEAGGICGTTRASDQHAVMLEVDDESLVSQTRNTQNPIGSRHERCPDHREPFVLDHEIARLQLRYRHRGHQRSAGDTVYED